MTPVSESKRSEMVSDLGYQEFNTPSCWLCDVRAVI